MTVIDDGPAIPKAQWTMPQLTFLEPAVWSTGRKAAMLAMRGYLVVSVVLLSSRPRSSAAPSAGPRDR